MKLIIRFILYLLSIAVSLLFLITIVFVFQKKNGNTPTIFGYTSFINTGTSMLPEIEVGDLILVKSYDEYEIGDIISFENEEEITVTHRIIEVNDNKYTTKGDNNKFTDGSVVLKKDIYGKVIFKIPKVGIFISYVVLHKEYLWYILGGLLLLSAFLKFGAKHAG